MSELSILIFHSGSHYISSPFGYRNVLSTSAGATAPFHNGVDYATYGKKLKQYALEDGVVLSCGIDTAYGGAKYVWVKYPRLGIKCLHYHLDSIKVKAGQKVTSSTVLGTTGKTGKATGIHLHLGMKLLSGGGYINPEAWFKKKYTKPFTKGTYIITSETLNVRIGPGTNFAKVPYSKFSTSAKKQIKKLKGADYKKDHFVKGMKLSVSKVDGKWGKCPTGWICLENYCKKK